MINNFNIFIFNRIFEDVTELNILFSKRLKVLLKYLIDNQVALRLLNSEDNNNFKTKRLFIDIDENDTNRLSFLMINKLKDVFVDDYDDVINNYPNFYDNSYYNIGNNTKLRGTIGINQFVNEVFKNEYISVSLSNDIKEYNKINGIKTKSQELEEFINMFKSYQTPGIFELVEGNDIIKYYNANNYIKGTGDLNNSCMRYDDCDQYIKFYAKNNNKVSLLIMKDKEDNEKITGRALVWKLDEPNRIFMDRIYTTKQYNIELFKLYAKKQGWLYKFNQNMESNEQIVDTQSGQKDRLKLIVNNIKSNLDYPYMDTLKYFFEKNTIGTLSNDINQLKEDQIIYKLESTEGGYYGGEPIQDLRSNIADQIGDDPHSYIRDYTYNVNFWNFIDDDGFIKNFKYKKRKEIFINFDKYFNHPYQIKSYIKKIDKEYDEKSFDKLDEKEIMEYLINKPDLKLLIIDYYLNRQYDKYTPEMILKDSYGLNTTLRNVSYNNYTIYIEKYLDIYAFAEDASNQLTFEQLLDW